MIIKIFAAKRKIAFGFLLVTVSLASHAQFPDGEFACQVLTEGGQSGLVLVQAEAEVDAMRVARTAIAWELDGGEGKAVSVVECITVPREKFRDVRFNRFYEDFPL